MRVILRIIAVTLGGLLTLFAMFQLFIYFTNLIQGHPGQYDSWGACCGSIVLVPGLPLLCWGLFGNAKK